ncbi:uncharacterized protein LOC142528338 [Primulina tabacum]|uniref:uncharacterized protein LOC142528338 n=1 Tax=Primulina tabacum TaxID=48773 RepID=UPI003F5A2095
MDMIWSMLTGVFSKKRNGKGTNATEDKECSICLSSLNGGGDAWILPCLHEFHRVCVERWLGFSCRKTCPICRFPMQDYAMEDEKKRDTRQQCFTEDMVIWFSSFHIAGF